MEDGLNTSQRNEGILRLMNELADFVDICFIFLFSICQ